MERHYFEAIATLVGTIIGAGILGIPYVLYTAGFITGIFSIVIIGILMLFLHLFLGEITLRTKGRHQLTGYAEIYLGKWGKQLMMLSMFIGVYGALIAYILGEGAALSAIFGGSEALFSLLFFIFVAAIVYIGLNAIERSELLITSLLVTVVIIISVLVLPKVNLSNLAVFSPSKLIIPYGVVLFAYLGTAAVPEMREILMKREKYMKQAIIIGTLIPLFVYILFPLVVIGVVGSGFDTLAESQRVATVALGLFVSPVVGVFANLFAVFAMSTSFLALGLALKETYNYDYKIRPFTSWLLVVLVPLIIFLADTFYVDVTNFINALSFAGAVAGGIAGILLVLILWKAKKKCKRKPEYSMKWTIPLGIILMIIFFLGIVNEIFSVLGWIGI